MKKLLLVFFLMVRAQAIEVALERRWMDPVDLNQYAGLTINQGQFSTLTQTEAFETQWDLVGSFDLIGKRETQLSFGIYGRYLLPQETVQKGITLTSQEQIVKTTEMGGFVGGVTASYPLFKLFGGQFFLQAGVGLGKMRVNQEILVDTANSHTLKASAMASEAMGGAQYQFKFWGPVLLSVEGGYSRHRSNVLTVDEADGDLYSAFQKGSRINITDGFAQKDLKIDRSGFYARVGFLLPL